MAEVYSDDELERLGLKNFVDPAVLRMLANAMHGHDGKPCRNSYGWCFQHMAKAVR